MENLHLSAIRQPIVLSLYRRSAYGEDVDKVQARLDEAGIPWPPDDQIE